MLIEKEEEAKFYRDIEAGLPFSEEVANRLGMLEYAKRYVNYHVDEKDLKELREWKAKGNNWNIGIITSVSDSLSISLSSSR